MNILELFARIGVKADSTQAERLHATSSRLKLTLTAVSVVAGIATAAIAKLSGQAMKSALEFQRFEAETGASAQTLQRWQGVADAVNGSAQSVTAAIRAISLNQEKIKLGEGDISGYQLLGIDPRADPFEIMEQLRQKTAGLSQAMKRSVLSRFGVGSDLIQVLELSREQFGAMAAQSHVLSPQAIESINRARASMTRANQAVQYLKGVITAGLAPSITRLVGQLTAWVRANEQGIVRTIKLLFTWLSRMVGALINAGRMIDQIVRGTIGWKAAIIGLLAVVALLNAAFLTSPLGLIIAGVVLLIAVLDDLYRYSKGKKSLFGYLMDTYPKFEEAIARLQAAFRDIATILTSLFSGDMSKMNDLIERWGTWGIIIAGIVDGLHELGSFIAKPGEWLERYKAGGGFLKEAGTLLRDPGEWWRQYVVPPKQQPAAGGGGQVVNQNNTINVNGAQDPGATADMVDRLIKRQTNKASGARGYSE